MTQKAVLNCLLFSLLWLFTSRASAQYFENVAYLESPSISVNGNRGVRLSNGNYVQVYSLLDTVDYVVGGTPTRIWDETPARNPGSGLVLMDSNRTLIRSLFWYPVNYVNDYIYINHVLVDASDHLYLSGRHGGLADLDPGPGTFIRGANAPPNGASQGFLVKLKPNGDFLWAKAFEAINPPGTNADLIEAYINADGHLMLSGYFRGEIDFDPGPSVAALDAGTNEFGFVVKLDTAGNYLGAKMLTSTVAARFGYMHPFSNGDRLTVGSYRGTVNLDINNGTPLLYSSQSTFGDLFLARYDSSDNVVWSQALPAEYRNANVLIDPNDNFFMSSQVIDTVVLGDGTTHYTLGSSDLLLEKYDAAGNNLWSRILAGAGWDFRSDEVLKGGVFYLNYSFDSSFSTQTGMNDTTLFNANGLRNVAVSLFDTATGGHLHSYVLEGDSAVFATGNLWVEGNRVDLTVSLNGPADLDPDPTITQLSPMPWYASNRALVSWRIPPQGTSGREKRLVTPLKVYPNPTSGLLTLQLPVGTRQGHLEVRDVWGRVIRTTDFRGDQYVLDLSGESAGIYLLDLKVGEGRMVGRVVVK